MTRGSVRANCKGKIVGCNDCKDHTAEEGYCSVCGRPLSKAVGEECGVVYAYVERGYVWKGKIKIKCRYCKTVNKI